MPQLRPNGVLETARQKFTQLVRGKGLLDAPAAVSVTPLSAEQAIGRPRRRDFPIVEGKELVIEATFLGARGHAFTDSPQAFAGSLGDGLALALSSNQNRAVFIVVLNAVLRHLDMIETSLHCQDGDPEECAKELAARICDEWGKVTVGLIGFNPAIAELLVQSFGSGNVRITDLNRKNIPAPKYGVSIWDGRTRTEELIRQSDVVLVTGTTLVNGTFDSVWDWIQSYGKKYMVYGVTGSGVCQLMNLNRWCPYGRTA